MLSSIWSKISMGLAFIAGVLMLMLRGEKSKRKAAEQEAEIAKGNVELLERKEQVISNIDEEREEWSQMQSDQALYNAQYIEELKHDQENLTDSEFTASIHRLHEQSNSKKRAGDDS